MNSITTLAYFPFLPAARKWLQDENLTVSKLATNPLHQGARDLGFKRLEAALAGNPFELEVPGSTAEARELLHSFIWARVLLSGLQDKTATRYFAMAEAMRAQDRLYQECKVDSKRLFKFCQQMGLDVRRRLEITLAEGAIIDLEEKGNYWIHFVDYLKGSVHIRDKSWRLVRTREGPYGGLISGYLTLIPNRLRRLLREIIRSHFEDISGNVEDPKVLALIKHDLERLRQIITARHTKAANENLGSITITRTPPCIRSLLGQLSSGVNISHIARLTITTFLHKIGLGRDEILRIFTSAPDHSTERTEYQVDHLVGEKAVDEYDPPACATLKTNGICIHPDEFCEQVQHPLGYYRIKDIRQVRKQEVIA